MLTLALIRRQEGTPQDLRGGPAPAPAGPQARAQAPHQRELVADQQPRPRRALAGSLPPTPTWQVHARRILLGHGYAGQCTRIMQLHSTILQGEPLSLEWYKNFMPPR